MVIELREHQKDLTDNSLKILKCPDKKAVLSVLPTGGGKTYVIAEVAKRAKANDEFTLIFAHRDILISQLSDSLCKMGVTHSFIASTKSVKNITNANLKEYGDSFYDEFSKIIVVSVDTFLRRLDSFTLEYLLPKVKWWLMDEAHHVLEDNKWGKCVKPLINAKGIGVTATPIRSDGKGLGSHSHGIFDKLVIGASQSELMEKGYLSLYKIYAPPMLLDTKGVNITGSGDYNEKKLAEATDKFDITGDAIQHYRDLCDGMQAITFAVNIAHAEHVAKQFNDSGIKSVALSSKTPTLTLIQALTDFRNGVITNLVNCNLFGEGFDVPAVSVVIMLRKTASYSLFKQQFGRCLRPSDGKIYGYLIDHVGNVMTHCVHGQPHDDPEWTLDAKVNSNNDSEISRGRICPECFNFYIPSSKNLKVCPQCNHEETKEEINKARSEYQFNEGKLEELNVEFVNKLLARRMEVDQDPSALRVKMQNAPPMVRTSAVNNHIKRQFAQQNLRPLIQEWCVNHLKDNPDYTKETIQRDFHLKFGTNIYKAQVLSERLTNELILRIKHEQH